MEIGRRVWAKAGFVENRPIVGGSRWPDGRENASLGRENASLGRENASLGRENASLHSAKANRHAAKTGRHCENPARKSANAIHRTAETTRQFAKTAQVRENRIHLVANPIHLSAKSVNKSAQAAINLATRTTESANASHHQETRARSFASTDSKACLLAQPFDRDHCTQSSEQRAGSGANLNLITKENRR